MKFTILKWITDNIVGKVLAATYKAAVRAGDTHEARHIYEAVSAGNSENCEPKRCTLDRRTQI